MEIPDLILALIGTGAGSSVITLVIQRRYSRRQDNAIAAKSESDALTSIIDRLEKYSDSQNVIIVKLQELACYNEQCKRRITINEA